MKDGLTDVESKSHKCSSCGILVINPWHRFQKLDHSYSTTKVFCDNCIGLDACYYCKKLIKCELIRIGDSLISVCKKCENNP